jgi:shikimate kinase
VASLTLTPPLQKIVSKSALLFLLDLLLTRIYLNVYDILSEAIIDGNFIIMKKSVYLIGGRAVGKSSIGVKLAQRLGYEFLDTDTLITEECGCSVAAIVEREGWPAFREYERQVLLRLAGRESCVVATGGGAILHREVWPELKKQGKVVWLTADLTILCERIAGDHHSLAQRPSLTGKDICQELKEVLAERNPLYRETADCIIDSGAMMVYDAVQAIEEICRQSVVQ